MTKHQDSKVKWQHILNLIYSGCKWLWSIEVLLWKSVLSRLVALFIGVGIVGNIVTNVLLQDKDTWKILFSIANLILKNIIIIMFILAGQIIVLLGSQLSSPANYSTSFRVVQQVVNWRNLPRRILIIALVSSAVGGLLWGVSPAIIRSINRPAPPTPVDTGIHTQMVDGELIGISAGKDAFDTDRLGGLYKADAMHAMNEGDRLQANIYWTMAAKIDTADAEAKIYVENQCILGIGKRDTAAQENCVAQPHKTILVVVPLAQGDSSNIGRDILQGAYITQTEYNQLHRNGPQLYLLIANIGEAVISSDVQKQVAKQIVQAIAVDPTIVGITGWLPGSSSLVQELNQAPPTARHPPMISMLPLEQPYIANLLSVAPSLQNEARAAITYITSTLHATNIAVVYPGDNDRGLGEDFIEASGSLRVTPMSYVMGSEYSLQETARRIIDDDIDLVYITGPFTDIKTLHTSLAAISKGMGNTIQIMSGDITYQWIHGPRSDIDDFVGLRFTASAFPDEWSIQHMPINRFPFFNLQTAATKEKGPPMVVDYKGAYDPQHLFSNDYVYDRADSDATLSYDAAALLVTALCQTSGNSCDDDTQKSSTVSVKQLWKTIQQFTPEHPFQGVSGQISFTPDNSLAANKAILVLFIQRNGTQSVTVESGKY
jgi:ABC-type branched-subunit amino acid transport system substrate-binding protein